MFYQHDPTKFHRTLPGIEMKTLVNGEKTLLAEVHMQKGSELPLHRHPHEQTGYMVSGAMRLTIEGRVFMVEPGDSWNVPGDAEHHVAVLEDTVVVEVFSPVREDYLKYLAKNI